MTQFLLSQSLGIYHTEDRVFLHLEKVHTAGKVSKLATTSFIALSVSEKAQSAVSAINN